MEPPLYYLNCYLQEFDATILSNPTPTSVILDKDGFYPTGGGQPHDTGEMVASDGKRWKVIDVFKDERGIIHELDSPAPASETPVHCKVDWKRRYGHMKYHTSCHILCAVIHERTQAKITGNQISLDHTRIDFNLETYDRALLEESIAKTNEIIKKGLPITLSVLNVAEASAISNLVKLEEDRSATLEAVRVVTIEGLDVQACGGTHVASTQEIGEIILERIDNKGKNNRRVYFTINPPP